jgi:hypothetical protein
MMLFTAAKLGTLQGSAIVVVGERWGAESALIMGPGEATLTPSTLVRIQVPQPYNQVILPHFRMARARRWPMNIPENAGSCWMTQGKIDLTY